MKVLLVEDSRLARAEMRRLSETQTDVEVTGEAANADEAAALIQELAPDLIFLDIQMPGRDGFELLAGLDRKGGLSRVRIGKHQIVQPL